VSEITLLWLMKLVVPPAEQGALPLLALASRLWMTIAELTAFTIAVSIWGGRKAILAALSEKAGGNATGSAGGSDCSECQPVDDDVR
jgi:hypothetical protein